MGETCTIEIDTELLDAIDNKIEEEGGSFEDWIIVSIIRLLLRCGGFSYAFKAYLKANFSVYTIQQKVENDIIEALKTFDK
jgi:hypothetical protein